VYTSFELSNDGTKCKTRDFTSFTITNSSGSRELIPRQTRASNIESSINLRNQYIFGNTNSVKMSSEVNYLEDVLIKCTNKLERCLPFGDLAGELVAAGIVTQYEYYELIAITNEMRQRRETVLMISRKPPDLVEKFCHLLKNHHTCRELGAELVTGKLTKVCFIAWH